MKVMPTRFLPRLIVLASVLLPTLEAMGQVQQASGGSPSHADAGPYAPLDGDGDPYGGYQSQSAYQTANQRHAATAVLENTVGYQVAAPFGPRLSFDGIWGDRRGIDTNDYSVMGFLPWHVDPGRNVVFTILRGTATDLGDFVGNFGVGQRLYFEDLNRIVGSSVWFDIDDTHNQTYHRAGAQLEYIGRYLELRGGADLVIGSDQILLDSGFTAAQPRFLGENIAFTFFRKEEFAYDQAYIEAGGPLPFLGRYGVNAYGGSYFVWHPDAEEAVGWSARVSAAVTRDVNLGFRFTHDDVFGANASASVSLEFPVGGLKQLIRSPRTIVRGQSPDNRVSNQVLALRPGSVASQLGSDVFRDQRMPVDVARRESAVLAIDPRTGDAICVIHVDPNAATPGTGTFENPFRTLEAARLANDPDCLIIRVVPRDDDSGINLVVSDTFDLFNNQRLLASSVQHTFDSTRGTFVLPGFTGPGLGPLVSNGTGGSLVRIRRNNEISGFRLMGTAGSDAVVGRPNGFNINRNEIFDARNGLNLINARGLGIIDDNEFANNAENGARIEVRGGNELDLIVRGSTFLGNSTGLVTEANTAGTLNAIVTDNVFQNNTDPDGGGYRALADGAIVNLLSVTDNTFQANEGYGMLLAVLNGGTLTSIGEDDNGNGRLDPGEDANGNGMLDLGIARNQFIDNVGVGLWVRAGEDFNRNNVLDDGEDLNGNGVLDGGTDTTVVLDIGGARASLGNRFAGNLGGGIAFDMLDNSRTTTRIRHNIIEFASAQVGDAIFVMDISGSTIANFGGTPVGDVNNDGFANTILDAQIAGFIALNQEIINLGGGDTSQVAVVAFDGQAFQRDMNPATAGVQLATTPLADADGDGVLDVDQVLQAEQFGGLTNFEAALQASINTFNDAPLTPGGTTLIFLSDGFPNVGGNFADEVATLQNLGVRLVAFGIGPNAGLPALQIIDPNATRITSTDELLTAFQGVFVGDGPPVDAVRMTFSDNARLRPSLIANNTITGYGRDGVNIETFNGAQVESIDFRSNEIRGHGRNGVTLAAANTSLINLTNMRNNLITNNRGNGVSIEAINSAGINLSNISGNMITNNVGDGMFIRSDGIGSFVAGSIGVRGRVPNEIENNMGFGINIESLNGGSILGPGASGNFRILNNVIAGNELGGISAFADATAPTVSTLNLTVGGPTIADGNVIDGNVDVGLAYSLDNNSTGELVVLNNEITNTTDDAMMATTTLNGQGIYIEVAGTSTLLNSVIDMNRISGNEGDGIQGFVRERGEVRDMLIGNTDGDNDNGNVITGNGGDGIEWRRRDQGRVINMSIIDNTLMNNEGNGLNLIAANADLLDTYTVNDNLITGNNGAAGVRLRVEADADMRVDMDNNIISMNAGDGIEASESTNTATDSRGLSGTWTNNIITDNGEFGIQLAAATQNLMVGTTGNGNFIDGNALAGVEISGPGSATFTENIITNNNAEREGVLGTVGGIDFFGASFNNLTLNRNFIANNTGTGVRIANLSRPIGITVNLNSNIIDLNTGDGLEINNRGFGSLTVNSFDNMITRNLGRGVDILNQQNAFSTLNFDNEFIASNGLEGFYVVNTASGTQNQTDLATAALAADGAINAQSRLRLTLTDSEISFNGNLSNFDGTGLVLRVGTNDGGIFNINDPGGFASGAGGFGSGGGRAGVIATVLNNNFSGNFGDDVVIESFTSTVDPITTAGEWTDGDDPADPDNNEFRVDAYETDALARLDLDFRGNTGDSTNVTRVGAFYDNPEPDFKSRLTVAAGGNTPAGPFTSATRRRNAQRTAAREVNAFGNFTPPAFRINGENFLYPGVGDDSNPDPQTGSTFRVTAGSNTAGFAGGDGFGSIAPFPLPTVFGELPFEWDIIP